MDRTRELFRGRRTCRMGLGSTTGAGSEAAQVLNRLLRCRHAAARRAGASAAAASEVVA